ncbi:MAG: hypothetical protein M3Z95_01270 [Actinomycetota bacterium]|nr:hypothetical protein [Actinomycetota bacterium]
MRVGQAGCAAAAVALLALSGCGSSKHGPTKATYIARAEAVCTTLYEEVTVAGENHKPILVKIREGIPNYQRANAQLRAIAMPSADRKVLSEWLHDREVVLGEIKKSLETKPGTTAHELANLNERSVNEAARGLAREYGLEACTRV